MPEARARRRRQHLPAFDATDLPVRPDYVAAIAARVDTVTLVSRWFNAVACRATPAQAAALQALPGVAAVLPWPTREAQAAAVGPEAGPDEAAPDSRCLQAPTFQLSNYLFPQVSKATSSHAPTTTKSASPEVPKPPSPHFRQRLPAGPAPGGPPRRPGPARGRLAGAGPAHCRVRRGLSGPARPPGLCRAAGQPAHCGHPRLSCATPTTCTSAGATAPR